MALKKTVVQKKRAFLGTRESKYFSYPLRSVPKTFLRVYKCGQAPENIINRSKLHKK